MNRLMYDVACLVATIRSQSLLGGLQEQQYLATDVIERAEAIDSQLQGWFKDARAKMDRRGIASAERSKSPIPTLYADIWSASLWNKCLALRILLHSALLRVRRYLPSPLQDAVTEARLTSHSMSIIDQMVSEILASVPFSLGDVTNQGRSERERDRSRSLGAYYLIWPLQAILRCSFSSADQRTTTRTILLRIGKEFGVSYASQLAQLDP